jgi:carboxyl-terminal processing protease
LVVLINRGSASGSEILASALRDNRGIKLIGEQSFGKGTVQQPIEIQDNSLLKITIAEWRTPNDQSIDGVGLIPDLEIKNEDQKQDLQLEKAIEVIKNIIK